MPRKQTAKVTNDTETESGVPMAVRKQFIKRWRGANTGKAMADREIGLLAAEMRTKFDPNEKGGFEFRRFLYREMDIPVMQCKMLCTAANAATKLSETDWVALGGWMNVQFVMNVEAKYQRKLVTHAAAFLNDHNRPPSYGRLREIAFKLGARSTKFGRPLRSESEARNALLRGWLDRLYEGNPRLPKPPTEVRLAMHGVRETPKDVEAPATKK